MPTTRSADHSTTPDICNHESLSFLMLSEVMRARCEEIVALSKSENIDAAQLRRLALHMKLSAEDLIRETSLIKRPNAQARQQMLQAGEPSSLQSILDLCNIAARQRLAELGLQLESPQAPDDLFAAGNPWEIAYTLFYVLHAAGRAHRAHLSNGRATKQSPAQTRAALRVALERSHGFTDLVIPSHSPLDPSFAKQLNLNVNQEHLLKPSEWFCLRHLLEQNNIHIHVSTSPESTGEAYSVVLRLPTFQPGHEDPIDFLKVSVSSIDS